MTDVHVMGLGVFAIEGVFAFDQPAACRDHVESHATTTEEELDRSGQTHLVWRGRYFSRYESLIVPRLYQQCGEYSDGSH